MSIRTLLSNRVFQILVLIFLAAVAVRFLYFPGNIYFGYDQARDAFISRELLQGHLKIAGPTTSIPGLNHGALFYYIFAPIYFISQYDPTGLSIFLRIYNALGVFLIFFIGKNLFSEPSSSRAKWVGIVAAFLYAISYEQTQYSLFMTHPALAVITVLIFYLGLSTFLFRRKDYGLIISTLGLGLSFQFHFLLAYLGLVFVLSLGIFYKRIPKLKIRTIAVSVLAFILSISTFILAEIRFKFAGVKNLISTFSGYSQGTIGVEKGGFEVALRAARRYIEDNIFYHSDLSLYILIAIIILAIFFLRKKENWDQIIFLLIWFIVGLFSYFANNTSLYFYGVGTSISLIILVSFFVTKLYSRFKIAAIILVIVVVASNVNLIIKNNPTGPNKEINVQTGMLLSDQKKAIDYIYSSAGGQPFAVNAFSMPIFINTTWAYLFEWYGKKEYGYLPIWGGRAADGYPGGLVINNARTTLPEKRFLIVEPIRGIEDKEESFMTEEGYFTDIVESKKFGDITVHVQKPK